MQIPTKHTTLTCTKHITPSGQTIITSTPSCPQLGFVSTLQGDTSFSTHTVPSASVVRVVRAVTAAGENKQVMAMSDLKHTLTTITLYNCYLYHYLTCFTFWKTQVQCVDLLGPPCLALPSPALPWLAKYESPSGLNTATAPHRAGLTLRCVWDRTSCGQLMTSVSEVWCVVKVLF